MTEGVTESVRCDGSADPSSARGCDGVGISPRGGHSLCSSHLLRHLSVSLLLLPSLLRPSHQLHQLRVTLHCQFFAAFRNMAIVELLGFCVSIFGMYAVVICLRFLLPCFITPTLSSILTNAEESLAHAVATGAIPETNELRVDLEMYAALLFMQPRAVVLTHLHSLASQFARMRLESHRSPGLFPQLWLAARYGLTCRLYSLASQIEAVRLKVEVRWAALRCCPTIA